MPPKKADEAPAGDDGANAEEEVVSEVLEGDFMFPDSSEYSGEYVLRGGKPVLHGKGRLQAGPEVFTGIFEFGHFREGTYSGADGSVYTGSFHNDLFHGLGEYAWADGRSYKGLWKEGLMHGRGRFENFSFGVDKAFQGFCVKGKFCSSLEGQENARREFLAEYSSVFLASATAALADMAEKAGGADAGDPKAKKGAPADDAPVDCLGDYGVPAEDDEAGAPDRAAVEESVSGPFPEAASLRPSALGAFAGCFAEAADGQGEVVLLEGPVQCGGFDTTRLKREQLSFAGQGVVFATLSAEPGALCRLVLVNVASEFDVKKARWKAVFWEEVPAPAA